MTTTEIDRALSSATMAIETHAWEEARATLEAVGIDALPAAGLSLLARAAWWTASMDLSLAAWQKAYKAWLEDNNPERAAEACLEVAEAFYHRLQPSVGDTWFRRAESLLAGRPDSYQQAWIQRVKSQSAATTEEAFQLVEGALAMAQRLHDRDLEALLRHDRGRLLIKMGDLVQGMAEMEEVMAEVLAGDVGPAATGRIYCNMLDTCEQLADYRRAAEWDEAARAWCEHVTETSAYPGICRVKRAQIKRLRGSLLEAEEEARRAIDDLVGFLDFGAQAWIEIGVIRSQRGDWEAALEAFARAHGAGVDPQPGLALVELELGKVGEAKAMLEVALGARTDPLDRARLLPAMAEVAFTAGDVNTLEAVSGELQLLTATYPSTALAGSAAMVRGLANLAAGDVDGGVAAFQDAVRLWAETRAPFEVGKAHLLLGMAFDRGGQPALAEVERNAAMRVFAQIGAVVPGQRRTTDRVALLCSDIVRSTELLSAIGDEAWSHILRWHDHTLRSLFQTYGGLERGHAGDGFVVTFTNATSAVECAVAIQQRLSQQRRQQGFAPELRIGLHLGDTEMVADTLTGAAVHACARICAMAGPNQILASGDLVEAAPSSRFGAQEQMTLRGLPEPLNVAVVSWET